MTGALGPERIKQLGLSSYKDLYDPVTNARAAFKLSGGSNWSPWSAYNNGKHLPYLKDAQTHKKAGTATTKPAATSSTATPTSSTVAAAPQKPQTPQQIAQEESSMSPAVASAATKPITSAKITPTETGSQSPPIMISQSPPPRSSGGSYGDGETVGNVPGFSSTNPDNLYTAYALKELNIVQYGKNTSPS